MYNNCAPTRLLMTKAAMDVASALSTQTRPLPDVQFVGTFQAPEEIEI
jgi:hypothetical protein